jgi:hypothetical protein
LSKKNGPGKIGIKRRFITLLIFHKSVNVIGEKMNAQNLATSEQRILLNAEQNELFQL